MKLIIGSDHRGFHMKLLIQEQIKKINGNEIEWLDAGCFSAERCDYPEFAVKVCEDVLNGSADRGILICGSGIGMAITANRYPGIYAALVWNESVARLSKEHEDANVLVLPSDFIATEDAVSMIKAWLSAQFLGGRYKSRLEMVDTLTQKK
jgi:RpiB/LacA/LacB family sugar-phosphate isomerase